METNITKLKELISNMKKIKNLFHPSYKVDPYMKKITVVGGYGYANTGDEAQLSETIRVLKDNFPQYQIKVLTPNPDYTFKEHGCNCDFASRVLFFNQGLKGDCYDLDNSLSNRIKFLSISIWVYFNLFLMKYNLPTIFINSSKKKMLTEIKTSNLLYFCGGGYLTGKTLSRLWDGVLLVKLAKLLNIPIVMSGQTIGVWSGKFNEFLAKLAFKDVDLITVRDKQHSLKDLDKIGVRGENVFYTHDDALFCGKKGGERFFEEKYVTLNFHYWGVTDKEDLLQKLNKIVELILKKKNWKIIFISMYPTDKIAFDDYINKYPNENVKYFEYQYDFRDVRKVIAESELCITMKHHPIIFAIGESVPAISIAYSNYYVHKNNGALELFRQERFSFNLEDENHFELFSKSLDEIMDNPKAVLEEIEDSKKDLILRKMKFLDKVKDLLK